MPPRSRLKKLLSSIREKKGTSNVTDGGATTSHATDEHPLVPVMHDRPQTDSSTPEVDDGQPKVTGIQADMKNPRYEDPLEGLMMVDAAIEIVAIIKEASEASSILGPLKSICGTIIRVLEIARPKMVNAYISKEVMEKLEAHSTLFETEAAELESHEGKTGRRGLSSELLAALRAYLQTLEKVRSILLEHSQRKPKAYYSLLRDIEVMKGLDGQIDETFKELMHQIQTHSHLLLLETSSKVIKLRLSNFLERAVDAQGERVKPLTQGTRLALIEHLNNWARSRHTEKPLFWLHDEAGTGKSALAAHMAKQWQIDGVLAARFFFNKDGVREFYTLRRFCVTLAKEIVTHHPSAEGLMLTALEANPDLGSGAFPDVLNSLVISTAERLGKQLLTPLIFIFDALDECDEDDMRLLITTILDLPKSTGNVRFLLTSRSTKAIKALLEGAISVDGSGVVLLDVKHGDVQRDLDTTIYIRQELAAFPPADQNVVIECAKGVFLWATLACEAVKKSITPPKALRRLQANISMKPMDLIYETVLDSALPPNSSQRDFRLLQNVLQGVTLTYNPVSIVCIREFYPENKNERVDGEEYVELYVGKLGSIMKDGTPYLPIYLLHPTFREFIESQQKESRYHISPHRGHHSIAMACLDLLTNLTPDVFGVATPELPLPVWRPSRSEYPMPLSQGKEAPLRYAIVFWAMHASVALRENETIGQRITSFFASQLLVWIEWFAALEEMSDCIEGLRTLRRNIRTAALLGLPGVDDIVEKWCIDALRFVLRNSIILEQCGLQAWVSALAFTSKKSLVYQTFHQKPLRPLPILLTSHADGFDENRVLGKEREDMVYASFSPDGKRLLCLALSADPGLWNVKTSKIINELTGHRQAVIAATFSSDGSLIATGGADMIVCLSNGFSGTLIKKLPPHQTERPPHHTDKIQKVVFALSDTVVVSIATKGSILRWNVAGTKDDMNPTPMQGNMHTDLMIGLVASYDSKFVATFSYDMTVRLWEVGPALAVGKPMCGTDKVFSTAFSIDDTRIIAGYDDGKVIVWNTATQEPIHHLLHDTKCVYTIVVSPDMRTVAACGGNFCLWDINTGKIACPPLTGHSGDVWSVAFNKDGNRMASGSYDKTIRIWDIRRTGEHTNAEGVTLRGHTNYINYVSLASDGRMLASASGDGTLRLWDTDLLDTSSDHEPSDQLHGRTMHLLLSGDKLRLLSAGQNGTLQMWDFTTGQKIGELLQSEQGHITSICISLCGKLWASGHLNGNVCLWQDTDNAVAPVLHTLPCHKETVECITLAQDNNTLVTGSWDHTVQVWNLQDYTCAAVFNFSKSLTSVAISPDGGHMAAASHDEMRVWNLHSLTMIWEPILASPSESRFDQRVDYMVFSPGGTVIITRNGTSLKMYDLSDRMRLFATCSLDHDNYRGEFKPYPTPTFSPDGRYLFCGSRAFDFANMTKVGHRTVIPLAPPEALASNPISPLFLMRKHAQIHSTRWEEPILLIPPDINVDRGPWVAFDNTIAFGSLDGRVFIVRFPNEYM